MDVDIYIFSVFDRLAFRVACLYKLHNCYIFTLFFGYNESRMASHIKKITVFQSQINHEYREIITF